jgi:hypothetical protein
VRQIPETANRQDWPRLVAQAFRELQARVETSVERDVDGNPVPVWKPHTFTYNESGGLETDTITDGTYTWVRTYSYDNGAQIADSGWVKQ